MTHNNRHIRNSFSESGKPITSITPSPAHTALRRLTKVAWIILGMIIGIVLLPLQASATRLNINIRQLNQFRFNTGLTQFLKNRFDYDCGIAVLSRATTYAYNFHHFNSFV